MNGSHTTIVTKVRLNLLRMDYSLIPLLFFPLLYLLLYLVPLLFNFLPTFLFLNFFGTPEGSISSPWTVLFNTQILIRFINSVVFAPAFHRTIKSGFLRNRSKIIKRINLKAFNERLAILRFAPIPTTFLKIFDVS